MPESASPIRPLKKRRSVGADTAEQLRTLIQDGTYKPGDRLPGQRELAREFGISLAGVREAISVLSAAGLVDATPGRGTIVRSAGDSAATFDGWLGAVRDEQEFDEMLEVRRLLEAFTLTKAVGRATPEQLETLRGVIGAMRRAFDDPEAYAEADMRFHLTIAEIAGNRTVTRLLRVLQQPLMEQLRRTIAQSREVGQLQDNLATHVEMLEGLQANDAEAVRESFEHMLRESWTFMYQPKRSD